MKQNVKVVFDRKNQAAKTGIGKVEILIYLSREERKYETVATSDKDSWEVVAQGKSILAKMKHYEQIINAMKMLGEEMTIENFNTHIFQAKTPTKPEDKVLFNGHDQRQSFVDYCREHMNKEDLRPNSLKNIRVVLASVEESGLLKTLADLTPANVRAFDEWLHSKNDKTDYTISGYHKKVHKYTKLLWRNEMIPSDPYDHVKFPRGRSKERNPLTEAELLKMREAKYTGRLERVRDMFIFMAYTGLAYCDMAAFDYETMTEKHGKTYYIDGSRLKTNSKFFTPILPPAYEVLKKYNYKLPLISNQKLNDYCHLIQSDLKINKEITCHVARHSFATLMISYGVGFESTARMMGHKDIKTTQLYGKILKKTVEDKVSGVLTTLK